MQCSNKLKQLGLALHNYHSIYDSFPPALGGPAVVNSGDKLVARRSILVPILAHLENASMYESAYASDATAPNLIKVSTGQGLVWALDVPAFLCPSDAGSDKSTTAPETAGKTNYVPSLGDWADSALPGAVARRYPNPRGFASEAQAEEGIPGITRGLNSILDGTSNTIAMGEIIISVADEKMKSKVGTVIDGASAIQNTKPNVVATTNPGACLSNVSNGEYNADPAGVNSWKGSRWCQGLPSHTGAATLLPPNGPSCTTDQGDVAARLFNSFSSYHTGGINAVLADGSVRFISDSVDTGNLMTSAGKLVESGPSNFGVWGAYGSIDGGEAKSF